MLVGTTKSTACQPGELLGLKITPVFRSVPKLRCRSLDASAALTA